MTKVKTNSPDTLSKTILKALGQDKLQGASKRQLELMDKLLEMRLEESEEPVTEAEIKGMYEIIMEEVLPISIQVLGKNPGGGLSSIQAVFVSEHSWCSKISALAHHAAQRT
jgi:hypothetical protein